MTACATALLALTCGAAVAKDQNRGQSKKEYRQFNENQRQYARTYYNQNQRHFGQDSRWNNDYESRLRPGYVLDNDMRRMSRPAPSDLTRGLGRAPRGYRYIIIGGHVVLVDNGYRVHDSIHLHISF
jgi:Ni/Co efflux regulator RcnB